ncbi:plasma membrane localization protein [Rhizopus stolonifer]|uniref:Plasma membrane localization protein n=1 Tax=Rhizopus stolonifer TaxID=4846 RepID=A0A367IVI1_RHIST|nr:plasma membrane localization protein [Rhizopus stolonifer]
MPYCIPYRSKHARIIENCYPLKGGTIPLASELSYLTFYATSRPAKLTKVGSYIQHKVEKDIRKQRKENNIVSLLILKALIQSCHGDLNMFSKYLIYTFCQLMETQDIELIDQTCETFIVFCTFHDGSTLGLDTDFTNQYEILLEKLAGFCKNDDLKVKYNGQRGIQAAVSSRALLSSNYPQQLNRLLPCLLDNLTFLDHSNVGTMDIRESTFKNTIDQHCIQSIATHTICILFNKLTGHYIRLSLVPVFDSLHKKQWAPLDASVGKMRIIAESIQSQYKHLFLSEVLQHLDPPNVMSIKQRSLISILDILLNHPPLLGVSVLEILDGLFCSLVYASDEIQPEIIHAIQGLGSHAYYDNQQSDMMRYLVTKLGHEPDAALWCLDRLDGPLDVLSGLNALKDPTRRLWFGQIVYRHLEPNSRLFQALGTWLRMPNLSVTDLKTVYAIACRLRPWSVHAITLLFFRVQEENPTIDVLLLAWLKSTASYYHLKDLEDYTESFDGWKEEIPGSVEGWPERVVVDVDQERVMRYIAGVADTADWDPKNSCNFF